MPTRPKPSGTGSMLVQCKTAPFRFYLSLLFTSRSHTELNSPSSPTPPPPPTPPHPQSQAVTQQGSWLVVVPVSHPASTNPPPPPPSPAPNTLFHLTKRPQGERQGRGPTGDVGGTRQARSQIRAIFYPHFSEAILSSRNAHGCKHIQT